MMDPRELHNWSRHWDRLHWILMGILLAASGGLLIGYFNSPSKVLGVTGSALILLSIFFVASFRVLRFRIHRRMSNEERELLQSLFPYVSWPVILIGHLGLFAAWLYLLLKHYPEFQLFWVIYAVMAFFWFSFFGLPIYNPDAPGGGSERA